MRAIDEKVSNVQKQLDSQTAERQGLKGGWGYAVGVVGFIISIVSILMIIIRK